MELEKIKLSYPILSIDATIHFFTERNSTAIEWLLLEIVRKIENDPVYADTSLDEILRDIFSVDNSDQLARPCLNGLVDMGAVQISEYYDECPLENVLGHQVHITELGSRLQENGVLPGVENETSQRFYLDMARELLTVSLGKKSVSPQPQGVALIDESSVELIMPTVQIGSYLESLENRKKTQLGWIEAGTRIGDIDSEEISIGWIDEDTSIELGDGMQIKLPELTAEASKRVLDELSGNQSSAFGFLKKVAENKVMVDRPDEEIEDIVLPSKILAEINRRASGKELIIIPYELKEYFKPKVKPHKIVYLDSACEQLDARVDKDKMLEVYFPMGAGIESLYVDAGYELRAGEFVMHHGDDALNRLYGYVPKSSRVKIEDVVERLVQENYVKYPACLVILLKSKAEKDIDGYLIEMLKRHGNDDIGGISAILAPLDQLFRAYSGKAYFDEKRLTNLLSENLGIRDDTLSIDELIEKLPSWHDSWLFKKMPERFSDVVLHYVEKLESSDLTRVWDLLQDMQKNEPKILQRIVNKKAHLHLYTMPIVKQMIHAFAGENFLSNPDITPIDHAFHRLKCLERQVQDHVYPLDWSPDISKEAISAYGSSQREKLSNLKNDIEAWDEQMQVLREQLPEFTGWITADTYMAECVETIDKIRDVVSSFFPQLKYQQIYAADTCALMNRPDLVDKFKEGNALLIIPMTVLEELDRHKENQRNPKVQYQARQVIKVLAAYSSEDWLDQKESSNMERLPPDYKQESGDNKILSTVLRFQSNEIVFISDDRNFRVKAESLNIKTVSSEEFCNSSISGKKKRKKNNGV